MRLMPVCWLLTVARSSKYLSEIDNNNAQGEYYLTDIFALAVKAGQTVQAVHPQDEWEVEGINSREQLAELERVYQREQAALLMAAGVTVRDPARLDVRGSLATGTDNEIDVNCVFIGDCSLGNNVSIGPNCVITDSSHWRWVSNTRKFSFESAELGRMYRWTVRKITSGDQTGEGAKIGNFVETKNANIGVGSKVNHLSYVGDADVGCKG